MLSSHCNNNDKKKINKTLKKKSGGHRDSDPGYMDRKTTVVTTMQCRPMELIDKK